MRLVKIFLGMLILLLLLAGGLFVAVDRVDWNARKPLFERQLSALTGRKFEVLGDLEIKLLPEPALTAGGLRLANADWGSSPNMLETKTVSFSMAPLPLLLGQPRIRTVRMQDVALLLEERAGGVANWTFGDAQPSGRSMTDLMPELRSVAVRDLRVTYVGAGGKPVKLGVDSADIRARLGGGASVEVGGKFDDQPFALAGTLRSLASLFAGEGVSGNIRLESADFKLALDGDLGTLTGLDGIEATVEGSGGSLPRVAPLASLPARLAGPWKLGGRLSTDASRLEVQDLALKLGDSDVAGQVTYDYGGPRPRVTGRVTSERLDLRVAATGGGTGSEAGHEADRKTFFSSEPLGLEMLRAFDASFDITADRLALPVFTYADVEATLIVEDGRLRLAGDKGTIYGADADGKITIDASGATPVLTADVTARNADIGKVTGDWSDPPFMTGRGDFRVNVTGSGDSIAAIAESLDGTIRIVVGEGTAGVGVLERMVKTVGLKTLGSVVGQDRADSVPMKCFAANLSAESGLMTVAVLVRDTKRATVFGSGTIDLGREQWDLILKPKPKMVTLTTAVPIHVGGTFRDPAVTAEKVGALRKLAGVASLFVFPPAAVAGLADFGAGDNQCVELAKGE